MAILIVICTYVVCLIVTNNKLVSDYDKLDYIILDKVFKKGFKLQYDSIDEADLDNVDSKLYTKEFIGTITQFIPGINILYQKYIIWKAASLITNKKILKRGLKPLTEVEKEVYAKLESIEDRNNFIQTILELSSDDEVFGYENGKVLFKNQHLLALGIDKLTPLAYTYDEVIKLNKITNNHLKLCNVDGRKIAIIGIPPEDNNEISRVQFTAEGDYRVFDAEEIENEDGNKYLIYPLYQYDGLEDGVNEIKEARKIKEFGTIKQHN